MYCVSLVQIPSAVHELSSSQNFYGRHCLVLTFDPMNLNMSLTSSGPINCEEFRWNMSMHSGEIKVPRTHSHTLTHICTHPQSHPHTHMHTHSHTLTHICTPTVTLTVTLTVTPSHTYAHPVTLTVTPSHIYAHNHVLTDCVSGK